MDLGLVARMGRWCFRRRWLVLAVWLVAVIAGGIASGPVFSRIADGTSSQQVESIEVNDVLRQGAVDGGQLIGMIDHVDARSAQVREVITGSVAELATMATVKRVDSPLANTAPAQRQLSRDGRAMFVQVTLASAEPAARSAAIDDLSQRLRAMQDKLRAAGQPTARERPHDGEDHR